jgi:two-component sensor histidine kinase
MSGTDDMQALILAPFGRDGGIAAAILEEVGIAAKICVNLAAVVDLLDEADCAIMAEEALLKADRRALADWIAAQPQWSDFPFILLTQRGGRPVEHLLALLGNATVLERPFHPLMLANAVRGALRARRRQRETESHIEERQMTQERQTLLIRELHHRVKNTLSTVQAVLGATARSSRSVEEFTHAFSERVQSLAKTHNLLTEDYWQSASLERMLRNELDPYSDGSAHRVLINGPEVELSADCAVPLSMAIHELTTNAVKYGALSASGGRIAVEWDVDEGEEEPRLNFCWREMGGPPTGKPARTGFGSVLLTRVIPVQCSAKTDLDYREEGLRFKMHMPIAKTRLVPQY